MLTLRARALGYLSRREHSRKELQTKLQRHAVEGDDIKALLDSLEQSKLLSDARYTEARTHAMKYRYGSRRLEHELRSRGIDDTLVAQALKGASVDELARAKAIWARRFDALPADSLERAKQMRFLAGRGFSFEIIRKVLGTSADLED